MTVTRREAMKHGGKAVAAAAALPFLPAINPAHAEEDADTALFKISLKNQLRSALDELDPKEELVIKLRFGLGEEEPKTLKEIGELLNLSRERIRQIEAQALQKLNRSQKCQQLRGYLN